MGIRGKSREERGGRRHAGERGQISVLLGTMLLTLMLFFAFVVNTGMLVNAKINLQNAADLAAYSGAAVQARQLTHISYLNYEMRRQLKRFLFRYYVIGNMAQQAQPKSPSGGTRFWGPRAGAEIGVPAICVTFNPRDNYCQMEKLPDIPIPPPSALDMITTQLIKQLTTINDLRRQGCAGIGKTNVALLYYWLWNTDPELGFVETELASAPPDVQNRLKALRVLASGIGLLPQEILLRKRIKTLNGYVNYKAQVELDKKKADQLKQNPVDWAAKERPIQAFYSAYYTLGGTTFPTDDIKMTEILPPSGDGANLLKLDDIYAHFDAYAIDMAVGNSCADVINDNDQAATTTAQGQGDCVPCLIPFSVNDRNSAMKIAFGVAKDPKIMTYYALKLEAKAQLMGSPWGPITMKAYAAAQPFGSRIGPAAPKFTGLAAPGGKFSVKAGQFETAGEIFNLPVTESDPSTPSGANGWNSNDVLGAFYQGFQDASGGGMPSTIGHEEMLRAYQIAMVPNPWESGKYNIPNDLGGDDPFIKHFDRNGLYAIWAPLFDASSTAANSNPAAEVADMIDKIMPKDATSAKAFDSNTQKALKDGITDYVNTKLKVGKGDNGEGLNVYRIYDPYRRRSGNPNDPPLPITGLPQSIFLKEQAKVKTSWNDVPASNYEAPGRTGYSVKYVPLKMLATPAGNTTDGSTTYSNRLPASGELAEDIEFILH